VNVRGRCVTVAGEEHPEAVGPRDVGGGELRPDGVVPLGPCGRRGVQCAAVADVVDPEDVPVAVETDVVCLVGVAAVGDVGVAERSIVDEPLRGGAELLTDARPGGGRAVGVEHGLAHAAESCRVCRRTGERDAERDQRGEKCGSDTTGHDQARPFSSCW
jgi:hypothetical protein